ncbi:MAG: ATP-binding protein [Fimbriimonadales bacterium]|nr:ATP-binding protein [Fimbriimonadales bacterium]
MPEQIPVALQAELEELRRRVAELEHAAEVQEWGGQLFHESNIPQLLLDFETGAVLVANAAAHRFYGESLLQQPHINYICAENLDWETQLKPLVAQNRYGMRVSQQHADGGLRTVEAHYILVNLRGRPVVHLIALDITERIRVQQELERAYRLESLGRLAGGIAHDFNNILTAVIGFAELARGRVRDEVTLRFLEGILQATDRAVNLNKQLLAYARRQVVQLAPLDMRVWQESVLDILRRVLPENIRLETETDPDLGLIQGDANLLMQILLNLVVNARDAMPEGGVIAIRLQNKTLRHGRNTSVPPGRYVILTVADTGTGIPPDVLPHIFEPFYSTKPFGHGTGLGLAAVQGAVQQLDGYIEVQTELGKGTQFTVYFPRLTSSKPPQQTADTLGE